MCHSGCQDARKLLPVGYRPSLRQGERRRSQAGAWNADRTVQRTCRPSSVAGSFASGPARSWRACLRRVCWTCRPGLLRQAQSADVLHQPRGRGSGRLRRAPPPRAHVPAGVRWEPDPVPAGAEHVSAPDIIANMIRGCNRNPAVVASGTERTSVVAAFWDDDSSKVREISGDLDETQHIRELSG